MARPFKLKRYRMCLGTNDTRAAQHPPGEGTVVRHADTVLRRSANPMISQACMMRPASDPGGAALDLRTGRFPPLRYAGGSRSILLQRCRTGRFAMKYRSLAAALAASALAAAFRRARHRPRGHPLVDLRRRGGRGRRARQGLRRHRQPLGGRSDRRRRLDGAADHDQPHHRRRPDGRHPVQPRPSGRGAGRGRADARPDRPRHQRELGRRHRRPLAARELHARRQDLLRAGQHPLLAVALAVEQGLRGRRRPGSDQLGRVRRRRRRSCARPARCRSPWAARPGSAPAPSTCC